MVARNPILRRRERFSSSPTSIVEVEAVVSPCEHPADRDPVVQIKKAYEPETGNAITLGEFAESATSHAIHYGIDKSPRASVNMDEEEACLDHAKLQKMVDVASRFAFTGREEEALKTYKESLQLTKHEVARIQRQLQSAKEKPKYLRATINIVIHEEWTKVAKAISDIRTMMAIIFERVGDYENAIFSCYEAKEVYERQAQYDEQHYTGLSQAKENAVRMQQMALKMQEAKCTFPDRKLLHEIAAEIHRKIKMTDDSALKTAVSYTHLTLPTKA